MKPTNKGCLTQGTSGVYGQEGAVDMQERTGKKDQQTKYLKSHNKAQAAIEFT